MKNKTMAKILALCTTTILAVGIFAGCASTPAAQKEVTINFPSFWVGKDAKAKVMTDLITKFNTDNAGKIKIVVEEIADYNAYEDKMKTLIATNSVPDIFLFKSGSQATAFLNSGKLMDMTTALNDGWSKDFVNGSIKETTVNGKVMAIPFEYGVSPVIYNSALLAKAGYTDFPKTYTELFTMFDKLKAAGITPASQMTGENGWISMLWYSQLVVSIGGPDVYSRGLSDPAFLQAAQTMKKMFSYTTKDAISSTAAVAGGHFLNNETAMTMNGPWYIGTIKSKGTNNLYSNIKIAPAPMFEGGKGQAGGYIGFTQTIIGAGKQTDKTKEAAVIKFLKYMTNPTNVQALSTGSGAVFVINTEYQDKVQAEMMKQAKAAPYIVPHFQLMVKPSVATEFPQALSALAQGTKTPEQFIAQLKAADAQ